ncbi:hypothetical protein C5L14_02160 [Labrys okinawensis]|uniref:Uncharacterized protein n=1 Tax=Labrys okinawensis TaxID=346911 RepID=A0A2S9QJ73_9HYPH|nr:DUF6428 family protein [Labrys okinawensis]PRH89409.1 hypothetical protein C5L14_02160 [Labrys okinawensis]
MTASASPLTIEFDGDASLDGFLAALKPHAGKALVLHYGGRTIRPGYHVTEVKAGAFATLDCGGNPDAWRETILQVEDIEATGEGDFMSVAKFERILQRVAERVDLQADARLTFEVGQPGEPMRIFDVGALEIAGSERIVLKLEARPAICKPRHRHERRARAAACCNSNATGAGCC